MFVVPSVWQGGAWRAGGAAVRDCPDEVHIKGMSRGRSIPFKENSISRQPSRGFFTLIEELFL